MKPISAVEGFFRMLKDIWGILGFRYALFLLLLVLTGLVEGVSLASVVPLLAAMGTGAADASLQQNFLADIAVRVVSWLGVQPTVGAVSLFVLAALAASTLLYLTQAYIGARLQTGYVFIWQRRLATSIFGASWPFLLKHRQGDLVNALVTEAPRLGAAFYQVGLMITGLAHGMIYLGIAAFLSGATTLIVLVGGAVLFAISRPLIARAYATGQGILFANAELQSLSSEMVRSAKSLKVTAAEPEAISMLQDVAGRLRNHVFRNSYDVQLVKGIFDFGAASMVACVLYATHTIFNVEPAMTLVILAIFVRLMPKLTGLQQGLQSISLTAPAVYALRELLASSSAAREPADDGPLPDSIQHGAFGIAFDEVTVGYGEVTIIDRLSLNIRQGECVAFVGASGAGKTTLVDVLLGLAPVSSGVVRINGLPLPDLPLTSIRKRVGYMGQDATIYNTTIRRNVLWNHSDADESDYLIALKRAAAKSFVDRLPSGGETQVSNAGATLSGGEQQRVALARALLGNPGLLILDEATSALDAETEAAVTEALRLQKGSATVILITHRLASARVADRICVLDKGKIVETGSWAELYTKENGAFRRLYDLQIGSMVKTE